MRPRPIIWLLISLLCLGGAAYFWHLGDQWAAEKAAPGANPVPAVTPPARARATTNSSTISASTAPMVLLSQPASPKTNAVNLLVHRLSNTTKTLGQLLRNDHAILLENALLDTARPPGLSVPENLRATVEPGSYIVQARGPVNDAFRAALAAAGATVISYIPNNAYLVRASAASAQQLAGNAQTQAVLPYEPAYKLKATLFSLAMEEKPLPPGAALNLVVFADAQADTRAELKQLGADILAESPSPFGPMLTVRPPTEDWARLARLAGVQLVELQHRRVAANDLSRVAVGVATDTITPTNYMGLTGNNVLVGVNDTGVDAMQLDLTPRVTGFGAISLIDSDGHGTHVAGIIASSGDQSATVSNASGSINPGTISQYRGKAPGAKIYSQSLELVRGPVSDFDLQQNTALTNALISNNSWHYGNDNTYDIGAASFDAAVRDALPGVTGSQPTLYVFAAGNSGNGNDSGLSGNPGSIQSPGTAKNVITVGALELSRDITNEVVSLDGTTNKPWQGQTSSGNELAWFSSRGNVGIGIEGASGRFKPDVVAPGTFVVSTRSSQWNEQAYYNPSNHSYDAFFNQSVSSNGLVNYSVFIPENAVAVTISVLPNADSPTPLELPIFLRQDDIPQPPVYDAVRTNQAFIPPDVPLVAGSELSYSIGNPTNFAISFNLLVETVTTNDLGNYYTVLSNLNNELGPRYRYESGTSMSAADVSGTLALMQEFFEQRLFVTNSPALYKALLINGARSAGSLYSFQVNNAINYQGWGLPNLPNSLPPSLLTNGLASVAPSSIKLFDQSPTNALATDQSQTRFVTVSDFGRNQPLRVTLVWTDPPGNPVASVKLVNDLDLIVTNLDTGDVFVGNDIGPASNFNFPLATNATPNLDSVNNVENVYLSPTLGTNYSVTVVARHVNVNAVTAQTNNVVQDYALVISSGNGEVPDALTVTEQPIVALPPPPLAETTNTFANYPSISGTLIYNQRVGANTALLGTTNGITNQWHFYVLTNDAGFTNAAFVTFLPPPLGIPRMGATNFNDPDQATRIEADIDLYVSTDPNLLVLDPNAIAASDKSRRRGGTEFVVYSNSVAARVYYVGVKSEDQMAAEYSFLGVFSAAPFSSRDAQGNLIVNGLPLPAPIPDGTPADPGAANVIALAVEPITVRQVIVTNSLYTENLGDLLGNLSHDQKFCVLNNHRGGVAGDYTFIYDDSGEVDLQHTDGPGSLRNFTGEEGQGVWLLTMVDNSQSQTGMVTGLTLKIAPTANTNGVTDLDVAPNSFAYLPVDVPVGATNLMICVANLSPNKQPVQLYVRREGFPTRTVYDYFKVIPIIGDCLSISTADLPPLQSGRYFIGVYNSSGVAQRVRIIVTIEYDLAAIVPLRFDSTGYEPLRDDAVTYSSIFVTNLARIAQAEVALRIDHPRVSDLAITLISPRGTRLLLMENRGMTTPDGIGTTLRVTNVAPVSANGDALPQTNIVDTGTTVGMLTVDYDFQPVPDRMTIYYENTLLYDTGPISGAGRFTVNYGPGASTFVTFVMNEGGDTNRQTAWDYTVSSINDQSSYLIFTENTNHNGTPIKFVPPPYVGTPGTNFAVSDFEPPVTTGNYIAPAVVDGWSVLTTNPVTVVTNPLANTGVQSLSLRSGQIERTLPTTPGRNYRLSFVYRNAGNLDDIISWWPGEAGPVANDIVGTNNGVLQNVTFAPGEVGQGFNFNGVNSGVLVPASSSLDVGLGAGFTLEAWIYPNNVTGVRPIFEWKNNTNAADGAHFWISYQGPGTGYIWANIIGVATGWHPIFAPPGSLAVNQYQHVALTYDKTSGQAVLYVNGVAVVAQNLGIFTPATYQKFYIGLRPPGMFDSGSFSGVIDEGTLYGRALAAAEIQAIYAAGAAGKCGMDAPPAVCQSLASAQVFVPGVVTNTIIGTGVWQTNSLLFTASQTGTDLDLVGGGQAARAQVANGSFELGLSGWTANAGIALTLSTWTPGLPASDGTNALEFGYPDVPGSVLSQEVPIVGGYDYTLQFDNFALGAPPKVGVLRVEVNSAAGLLASQTVTNAANDTSPWTYQPKAIPFSVPVGVTNVTLRFSDLSPNNGNGVDPIIDNVRITSSAPAMLVDTFTLAENSGSLYALPEQFLKSLVGESAYGEWKLEVWDNRAGATNPTPTLVNWQLQLVFQQTARPGVLVPGVPGTNTIPPGLIAYFIVDVPPWANFATNTLLFASSPVNLLFNQTIPPSNNVSDVTFLNNATSGSYTLSTNGTPPLLPGQRYYLGVQNISPTNVTFAVQVDFDVTALTNAVPLTSALDSGAVPRYFSFDVSTNATAASFQLLNLSGNVNLVVRQGAPLPTPTPGGYDYGSFNPGTADENIFLVTNSAPVPLGPGLWYLGVFNADTVPVTYTVLATEFTNQLTITPLTNRVPVTATLDPGPLPRYFSYDVSTNASAVLYQLLNLDGNVNLVARKGLPLPTLAPGDYDYGSFRPGTNNEAILITSNSAPVALSPGVWYLGVFNVDVAPVTYTILATELVDPIITLTNGIPYFNTNSGAGNLRDAYRYVVTPAAARAQFEINNPSGDMVLVARKGPPPPDVANYDYLSNHAFTNDELIVVFTNSTPVPLTPGDWYLSALNYSGGPVSYSIKATEWPVTGQPILITNATVLSNEFCITWTSLPGAHYYVEGLTNLSGTNWVVISPTITATDYATTYCVPLPSPYHFFRVGEGIGTTNAPIPALPIITLANGVPYAGNNPNTTTNIDYYRYVVTTNAVRAQFEINNPGGDLTLLVRQGQLPTLASFDYQSTNSYTNDELIVVFDYSNPVPLAPGDWYLAAVNVSGGPVAYSIKATEWPQYGTNLNARAYTTGTNSFCLTWDSLIGAHYFVSGRTSLSSTNWDVVSPTITATSTQTTWCIGLPTPYQFFQVAEGLALGTNLAPVVTPPVIGSVTVTSNGFLLQWTAPTSQSFQVQWATNLPPVPWMTVPGVFTSGNGQFSFFDDGTQTGGLGPVRFYRLQLYP